MHLISWDALELLEGDSVEQLFVKRYWVLFLLVIPTTLFASGRLRGVVIDSTTKEPLVGANVMIVGTSSGAATGLDGSYLVQAVPAGRYAVKCSYIGYFSKKAEINISDGRTTELDFALRYGVVQGKEVVITAQATGQAAAINQQITSDKIVNVVSEQKIRELPDANAAEALGRLPGVSIVRSGGEASQVVLNGLSESYATITLDGVKLSPTDPDSRGVDLSTIPQAALSGIVLTEAVTSDMDGEAIAGNVNFVTKPAPEKRTIQVTAQGSYGQLDNTFAQYNLYGNYGERFFNNLLGVQLFGDIEQRDRSSENYNVAYDQTLLNNTNYQISDFTIDYVPEIRRRRGAQLLLDFDTPDHGVIKFNGDLNNQKQTISTISRDYPVTNGSVTYSFIGQDINTNILDLSLQGENHLRDWQLNWDASFVQSNSESPYDYQLNFLEPSTTDSAGNILSGMKTVPVNYRHGPYQDLIPYALDNFNAAYLDHAYSRAESNLDFQKTVSLDVTRNYDLWDMSGELKFGGKYYSHYHRRNSSYMYSAYYNGVSLMGYTRLANGSIVPKNFAAYGFGNLLETSSGLILLPNFIDNSTREVYNEYLLDPMINPDRVRAWYDLNINGINPQTGLTEYVADNSESGTDYNLTESVGAGYLMNTLNAGTFATLITGVRFEFDNDRYFAYFTPEQLTEFSTFQDTTALHSEGVVLPNFHLILRPSNFMNIRLSAYRGLARPNFNYRLPTYVVVGLSSQNLNTSPLVTLGNPKLKNADAWNYEANLQFFGNKIGLLSVSAFYKVISNDVELLNAFPIFPGSNIPDSLGVTFYGNKPPFTTSYDLTYPFNSPGPTRVWGFEIQHQVNFLYLPGFLSNFLLTYNLSIVKTETYTPYSQLIIDTVTVPGLPFPIAQTKVLLSEEKTSILNSPQLFANIVLGYDIAGFSARLSFFAQAQYYNGFSSDQRSNNIQDSFERLDLVLKQNITGHLAVGLDLDNLTNAVERTSLQNIVTGWTLETSSVQYGRTADLWLRATI